MPENPYRISDAKHEWAPSIGDRVAIVDSDWSLMHGWSGLHGRVQEIRGSNFVVKLDDPRYRDGVSFTELYVHLREIAPEVA